MRNRHRLQSTHIGTAGIANRHPEFAENQGGNDTNALTEHFTHVFPQKPDAQHAEMAFDMWQCEFLAQNVRTLVVMKSEIQITVDSCIKCELHFHSVAIQNSDFYRVVIIQ